MDNYYQLVYYPDIAKENEGEHRMIIFDYDYFSSNKSFAEIRSTVWSALASMDEEDYFMICYNDFVTQFSSDDWLPATLENIDAAMSNIEPNSIIVESRLPVLISEAMTKIEELKQETNLIIVSPNNEYYEEERSNAFLFVIDQFYSTTDTKVNISAMDYAYHKTEWEIGGIDYSGNDFFYETLTEKYEGVHYNVQAGDEMYGSLVSLLSKNRVLTDQFDFQIGVENGFTYSNFINIKTELPVDSGKPIVSVGKYVGDGLFDIRLSAKVGDEVFTDTQKIDPEESIELDEMAEVIWDAEWIKEFQNSGSYEDKTKVIQKSIEERLLSLHTVFLCLEPDLESISGNNNSEETIFTASTEDEPKEDFQLKIYPNPFLEKFTIEVPINDVFQVDQLTISLLDARGQMVDRFNIVNGLVNGINTIECEPNFDLVEGLYIVQIEINNKMYNQKVLHLRS